MRLKEFVDRAKKTKEIYSELMKLNSELKKKIENIGYKNVDVAAKIIKDTEKCGLMEISGKMNVKVYMDQDVDAGEDIESIIRRLEDCEIDGKEAIEKLCDKDKVYFMLELIHRVFEQLECVEKCIVGDKIVIEISIRDVLKEVKYAGDRSDSER